jgi:O-glycosyl hydrolase
MPLSEAEEPTPTSIPVDGEIRIKPLDKRQIIEGFGASGAWWAQDVGGWEDGSREQIVKLLFDQQEGIGLSIYRYNIGGGDGESIPDNWRRAETFEVAQGEYDWSRDANAVWVLKAAQQAGVEKFVAFANSPPARMTYSGRTNADPDQISNLPPEMYPQFAQYLVDVVRHLQEDEGIPIGWLSPINEPQWDWLMQNGQEGCHYEPDEAAAMTKELIKAIKENDLDVKISVFESGEWKNSTDYIDKLLGDPEVATYLDHLAIHSYWSDIPDKERLIRYMDKNYPELPIEMTEWTEMEQGRDIRMDSALMLANTIYQDLTIGRVISWQYWIAVSKYNFHDGLLYVALNDHEITETKRLWAMGNFSRFVRPGYQLIGIESSLPALKTTAFQSADASKFVIVFINNGEESVTVSLNGFPNDLTQLKAYQTSADLDLAEIFSGAGPQMFTLAPKSVTTFVYQK